MERNLTDYRLFFQKKQSNPSCCAPFSFPILRLLLHKEASRNTRTQPLGQRAGISCVFFFILPVENLADFIYICTQKGDNDCENGFERWITNLKNMGTYINRGNSEFCDIVAHEYVDKTSLIPIINARLNSESRYSCVTRCRRFGKSMAAKMLCA